jgi:predicted nucleic acid-binding Zn ribbon protein
MPTYEFRLPDGTIIEKVFKISEVPDEIPNPNGEGMAVRIISGGAALVFKGSGFYLTDYGRNAHRTQGDAAKSSGSDASGDGSSAKGEASSTKGEGSSTKGDASSASDGGTKSAPSKESGSKPAETKASESKPTSSSSGDSKSSGSGSSAA